MLAFYLALVDDEPSRLLFEELYLAHRHTMVCAATRILHDQMLAEDATHDAFIRIINHLEKISDPHCHKTRSFVVLIVRNIALDYYRRMKRLAETSFDENEFIFEDQEPDPAELFEQMENRDLFRQKAAKLRPIYAEVLALRYSFEYTDREIAELLGISGETVRTRLRRARQQLRLDFEEKGD
ncbi:MAG TPA: RNA polymerase subunit sigma-24 [Clostridiales bacterium]|nr:RNA polymerase subunit sigma-24 [Clostridiales bacterium]